jgi:LmbE family N-acetylglucosaminyl deacetylase
MPLNVVAVGAHQDDVELNCLGTLLLCRARGDSVTIVTTTNGERGSSVDPGVPLEQVSSTRDREARAVADELGPGYACLGYPDQYLRDTDEARTRLCDVIRAAVADLVLAPPPADYHSDHTITSRLASDSCLLASVASVPTAAPALERTPALWFVEPVAGMGFEPAHYVDVSGVFAEKLRLIELHASQVSNMRAWAGFGLTRYAETINGFRGIQCGVRYAEAFRPCLSWPRARAGNPLP